MINKNTGIWTNGGGRDRADRSYDIVDLYGLKNLGHDKESTLLSKVIAVIVVPEYVNNVFNLKRKKSE